MAHCFNINFSLMQKITFNNVQNRRVLVYDFGKFDCTCTQHVDDWGILLVTICYTLLVIILVRRNGKHISHMQKILKRDEE